MKMQTTYLQVVMLFSGGFGQSVHTDGGGVVHGVRSTVAPSRDIRRRSLIHLTGPSFSVETLRTWLRFRLDRLFFGALIQVFLLKVPPEFTSAATKLPETVAVHKDRENQDHRKDKP